MKLLKVEGGGYMPQCPIADDATDFWSTWSGCAYGSTHTREFYAILFPFSASSKLQRNKFSGDLSTTCSYCSYSGVASYGALGHVPPSTSNNFIFSSLRSKSESQLSKYCVVCEISWCRCQQLTALSTSTAIVTKLSVIEQLPHPGIVSAPWHNFDLCPSSQQILATPLNSYLTLRVTLLRPALNIINTVSRWKWGNGGRWNVEVGHCEKKSRY